MRYYEDFHPGDTWEYRPFWLTAEEIIAFASTWDPQPYHVDPAAAAASAFKGLVASGAHIVAALVRANYRAVFADTATVAGRGFEGLRFRAPVRPGQVLEGRIAVVDCVAGAGNRGIVHFDSELQERGGRRILTAAHSVVVWSSDELYLPRP